MQTKSATIVVRVTPAEKRRIAKAAKSGKQRLSAWVRGVLVAEAGASSKGRA